jgi:hypothetical protein
MTVWYESSDISPSRLGWRAKSRSEVVVKESWVVVCWMWLAYGVVEVREEDSLDKAEA